MMFAFLAIAATQPPHPGHAQGKVHMPRGDMACPTCHGSANPDDLTLHTPYRHGLCEGCHNPDLQTPKHLITDDPRDLCLSCHSHKLEHGPDVHLPADGGLCELCHSAHGGVYEGNQNYFDPEPCISCHNQVLIDGTPRHGAIIENGCVGCHDPHSSKGPYQLRTEDAEPICFRCHLDDANNRAVVHKPVREGQCSFCHNPHGSHRLANLNFEPRMVCMMCHGEKLAAKEYPHQALELGCTQVCHDPHASDNPGRLRMGVIETCTGCHVGYEDGTHAGRSITGRGHPIGTKPHPFIEGRTLDCAACHDPHGSDNPNLFRFASTKDELCGECHGGVFGEPSAAFKTWLEEWKKVQAKAKGSDTVAMPESEGAVQ